MEPIKPPAAESPANLKRQTSGGLAELVVASESEVIAGFGPGIFSISESESGFLGLAGVDIVNRKEDKPYTGFG